MANINILHRFVIGEVICFQIFLYSLDELSLPSFRLSKNSPTMIKLWRILKFFIYQLLYYCYELMVFIEEMEYLQLGLLYLKLVVQCDFMHRSLNGKGSCIFTYKYHIVFRTIKETTLLIFGITFNYVLVKIASA